MITKYNSHGHDFDQEIFKCPTHGLSLDSDFLCTVCRLYLEGKKVGWYEVIEKDVSGVPQVLDKKTGEMQPAFIVGNDKYYYHNKRQQDAADEAKHNAKRAKINAQRQRARDKKKKKKEEAETND